MGTVIRATGVSTLKSGSAIELAVDAAGNCIASSGAGYEEISLLINAGVYRDNNICEPSVASLMQQKLRLNLEPVFGGEGVTFAFDQRDGAAGFISSCNTADAWLAEGDGRYALVVASDSHPSAVTGPVSGFPFTAAGSAVLLEKSGAAGFGYFGHFSEGEGVEGVLGILDFTAYGSKARENIVVTIPPGYSDNLLEALSHAVKQSAIDCRLELSDCCIVAAQPESGFSSRLAGVLGIGAESVTDIYSNYGFLHSAATGAGLDLLLRGSTTYGKKAVICAAPGAGMGISTAVYYL